MRIALCPVHKSEMDLAHRSLEMDAWHCQACGFSYTVTPDGVFVASADPTGLVSADVQLAWVEKHVTAAGTGRLHNWDGA